MQTDVSTYMYHIYESTCVLLLPSAAFRESVSDI